MSKKRFRIPAKAGGSERVQLSAEESLKRVRQFSRRKEVFITAIRKGKDRSASPDAYRSLPPS